MGIRASGAFFDVVGALYQVAWPTLNVAADLSINRSGVSIKDAALFYVAAELKNISASTCFVESDLFDVKGACKDSRDTASIVARALPYRRSRCLLYGGDGAFDSATGYAIAASNAAVSS